MHDSLGHLAGSLSLSTISSGGGWQGLGSPLACGGPSPFRGCPPPLPMVHEHLASLSPQAHQADPLSKPCPRLPCS